MTGLAVRPRFVTTSSPGCPSGTDPLWTGSSTSQMYSPSLRWRNPGDSQHSKLSGPTSVNPWWSITPRAPALLDPFARRRNAAPRLPRHNQDANAACGEGRARRCLGGHLSQSESIGRRTADDRGIHGVDHAQPELTGHSTTRHTVEPQAGSLLQIRPRSRDTVRTRTERTPGRRARRWRRDRPPSSIRASTASFHSYRANAEGDRSSTTSGSTACSARSAR